MRAVIQRVLQASVTEVAGEERRLSGVIETGFVVLVGVKDGDTEDDARYIADKVTNLRVFDDDEGKLNRALADVNGSVLLVSNFTLYGDCRKGRRPGFVEAGKGEQARLLYHLVGEMIAAQGIPVEYGVFGAEMRVSLVNDGPITLLLDSSKQF
jgi:D-aminoacyl-tRNA deacylase